MEGSRVLFVIMALSISTFLLLGVHFYIWRKLSRELSLEKRGKRVLFWLLAFSAMLIPAGRGLIFWRSNTFTIALAIVALTWLGLIFVALVVFLVWDLFLLGIRIYEKFYLKCEIDPSKRKFLKRSVQLGAATAVVGLGGVGIEEALCTPTVKRVRIPLKNLPKEFEGFQIALLTDMHIGATLRKDFVERVVRRTNELNADMVAVTGDLVDGRPSRLVPELEPMKSLSSKEGVFFVSGNHEYYSGLKAWMPEFRALGMRVLDNENLKIRRGSGVLQIAGVNDWSGGRFFPEHAYDLGKTLEGCDTQKSTVLLAHQPRGFHEAAKQGVDLQLSGHTHAGQIWPFRYAVALVQPYIEGLHKYKDGWIYVSAGTGVWGPLMRLGTQSEITLVELTKA